MAFFGNVQQRENDDYEAGARYDYIHEKYAADLYRCPNGHLTVDPFGCCYDPEDGDEGVPEGPRPDPIPFPAPLAAPVADDEIPF